ncbi:hypothetical protein [Sphingomonas glacialis]|uniref:hypothetical protein n=1 Tax=Sphingomonas glacialis TaxID=658225 RepID=UPI00112D23D7|nr:hypothetical protein [Sphingomonas glacialis]
MRFIDNAFKDRLHIVRTSINAAFGNLLPGMAPESHLTFGVALVSVARQDVEANDLEANLYT